MASEETNDAAQQTPQELTLYVVFAWNAQQGAVYTFYARDSEDADSKAQSWLASQPHFHQTETTACPGGYTLGTMTLPGHKLADEQEEG